MIVRRGKGFAVTTKGGGRTLGVHETYRKALAQLRAIEASKHKRAKGPKGA
jgi:hypothetical protein